jgi:YHS domain-containing protein
MSAKKLLLCCLFCIAFNANAGDAVYTGLFNNKAVGGYDPVGYFTDGKPVQGKKEFQFEYQGADWYFSSAENLKLFQQDPEKYAPQYGGFCAWAVAAKHDRAPGDPKYWKIVDNKLYLNYDKSVQEKWQQDIPGFIKEADQYWPTLLGE